MTSTECKDNLIYHGEETETGRQFFQKLFMGCDNDNGYAKLQKYIEQVLFDTPNFIKQHVGYSNNGNSMKELSGKFTDTLINKYPEKDPAEAIIDLINNISPYAVNVASPYFVGHMTSAIPLFMVQLKAIAAALNQNVVKLETSRVVSLVEKQVLAKLHRLIYCRDQGFYDYHVQNPDSSLGCFTEGGTGANITALWTARNALLAPKDGFGGVEKEGLQAGYRAYGINRCVVLVSELGHYSLKKAAGVLGIGNDNVIPVKVDINNQLSIDSLVQTIRKLKSEDSGTRLLAVVGIAGTTETGTVDPLAGLGEICAENEAHFHVDAAWGGPTLLSEKFRPLFAGIELADSVTIDGHKQFYMPMGCGMVYFKDPYIMDNVVYHANYINRDGSGDLGVRSLSGSREANSLILYSALKIMGHRGYGMLIENAIEMTRQFAEEIRRRPNFHLVTSPKLNILTYQIYPEHVEKKLKENTEETVRINEMINEINRTIQRRQMETGRGFVSRTTLKLRNAPCREAVVLRAVIANPMTNMKILNEVLDEQEKIYSAVLPQYKF